MDPDTRREEQKDFSKTTASRCPQLLLLRLSTFVDTFYAIVSSVQYSAFTCFNRASQSPHFSYSLDVRTRKGHNTEPYNILILALGSSVSLGYTVVESAKEQLTSIVCC